MLQEESDLSLIIAQIVQKLKGSNLYAQLERQAWASLQRPEIKLESLKEDIKEFFKISGWEKKLQNAVYSELNPTLLSYVYFVRNKIRIAVYFHCLIISH
uniref:TBC1 domain family member 19 n=1 Tax=Castor canadensis TaxID=51338 RepID=A0A8C0XIK9_CASCN